MMSFVRPLNIIVNIFLLFPHLLLAQVAGEATTSHSSTMAYNTAIETYNNAIGKNARIFTGSFYFDRNAGTKGHPFFEKNYWVRGSVIYEDQHYDSIDLLYNVYDDLLLVKYIDKNSYIRPIELYVEKVKGFTLEGHQFVRVNEDSLSGLSEGFYDVLYDGTSFKVLARRRKEMNRLSSGDQIREYITKDYYYIQQKSTYYQVNGRKAMMKVLGDQKSEIKAFLKKNKSRFRKNFELQLIETVRFYAVLSKNGEV